MQTTTAVAGNPEWQNEAYGNGNMVQFVNFYEAVGKPMLLAINNGRSVRQQQLLVPISVILLLLLCACLSASMPLPASQ